MYDSDNIFARIITGEITAKKLYEDEEIMAIHDAYPVAPVHILVMPKKPYTDYSDFMDRANGEEIKNYFAGIAKLVKELDLEEGSYRLVTNRGSRSGQSIFHFHTHIIGGKPFSNLI